MKFVLLLNMLLALILLSACGQEDNSVTGSRSGGNTYIPEYLPLEQGDTPVLDIHITDRLAGYLYIGSDENGATAGVIRLCSLSDQSVTNHPLTLRPEESFYQYTLDGKGSVYAILTSWHADDSSGEGDCEYILTAFDPEGKELFRQNISAQVKEDSPVSVREIAVDGLGRLYVLGGLRIWLYSSDGTYQGAVDLSRQTYHWFTSAGTDKKGTMYIAGQGRNGYELTEIDFDKKCLGSSQHNFSESGKTYLFGKGSEKDFLVSDGDAVYEYGLEDQSPLELFQWMDYDINGAEVQSICGIPGGGIAASGKDIVTGEYYLVRLSDASKLASDADWKKGTSSSEGMSVNAAPEKQEIVLAALSFTNDSILKKAVVDFNKASDKYHISLKEYGTLRDDPGEGYRRWTSKEWLDAITRLNADLTSKDCPDIVDISGIHIAELAEKDLFLDISPFLDNSAVISSADYPENVLEGFTYNGRLLGIPKFISVTTVMGHASDVGTEPGWTLEEMIAYAEAHPEAELFEDATKLDILNCCMNFYESYFIDWMEKKSDFDSPAFKRLLQFVNRFPDQKTQQAGEFISPPVKIRNRDVLLEEAWIHQYLNIQYQNAVFEEDGVFIGFPTPDGSPGHALHTSSVYAITSRSPVAEGAWEFIENYLADASYASHLANAFPSSRQELQKQIDALANVEYVTDHEGNLVLDENGNPQPAFGAGGTLSWADGWSYTYHHETPEELELARSLLYSARKSDISNGNGIIMQIISEETDAFFHNQKTLDETAAIIQNRVQLYLNESN